MRPPRKNQVQNKKPNLVNRTPVVQDIFLGVETLYKVDGLGQLT